MGVTETAPAPAGQSTDPAQSMANRFTAWVRWTSVGLIVVSLILLMRALPLDRLVELAQNWVEGLGIWGPVMLGLAYIVAALLFIPGWILTLAAGALYGLLGGTIIVSLASTSAAALAFLIARYLARGQVRAKIAHSPKLSAVDKAIGEQGWKIVALLRLSPAVPFNLQNYLYGVTAIRFWPCVFTSWAAMLPGTFMYVYLGSLGKTAAAHGETTALEWFMRGIGLLATIAVTVYVARLASNAIRSQTDIERADDDDADDHERIGMASRSAQNTRLSGWPWGSIASASLAICLTAAAAYATARPNQVRNIVAGLLGTPPAVNAVEAYERRPDGPKFDHSTFNDVLQQRIDNHGWVDYQALHQDSAQLDRYLDELAVARFDELGRNEKLALLINAYNAFTLRLILDHYPIESIQDIPQDQRWEAERWQVGAYTWSLNQIEHEQIRAKFREPRIHFALVCAAIGCPPLRNEAYVGERLEEQLASQAEYVHSHPRWFRMDDDRETVRLTKLFDWYRGDFTQQSQSILDYVSQQVPELNQVRQAGREPSVRWLKYDWKLNSRQNKDNG